MKLPGFKKPVHTILAGLVGLLLCALLVYVIEYALEAPNAPTLFYQQFVWTGGALLLFVLSLITLFRGISWAIQERRAERFDR
jgi:hypothetical protein